MKTYFAKYLPVEGEREFNNKKWPTKGIKLFICSRDIQVGDDYFNERLELKGHAYKIPVDVERCYKVIGEISPEAKWVTENMEIDEEDTKFISKFNGQSTPPTQHYEIKCPTCKTFH